MLIRAIRPDRGEQSFLHFMRGFSRFHRQRLEEHDAHIFLNLLLSVLDQDLNQSVNARGGG
jgi:hypothetical protein